MEPLLNRHEICKILRITTRTFDRWVAAGLLPITRISHKSYMSEQTLEKFIKDHTTTVRTNHKKN